MPEADIDLSYMYLFNEQYHLEQEAWTYTPSSSEIYASSESFDHNTCLSECISFMNEGSGGGPVSGAVSWMGTSSSHFNECSTICDSLRDDIGLEGCRVLDDMSVTVCDDAGCRILDGALARVPWNRENPLCFGFPEFS